MICNWQTLYSRLEREGQTHLIRHGEGNFSLGACRNRFFLFETGRDFFPEPSL